MVEASQAKSASESPDRVAYRYRYIVLALTLLFAGVVLLFVYALDAERDKKFWLILSRDIGIALIPAGTILLANEFFTHHQFEQMISDKMHSVIACNSFLDVTFKHAEAQRNEIKSAIPSSITGQNAFLADKFQTVEGQMDEILATIPFALTLRSLGVTELYKERPDTGRLVGMLRAADAESEIYMLGIALTDLNDGLVQKEVEKKLAQGCKMKLLWLDSDSPHVRQRAAEEGRPYVELQRDLLTHDSLHVNFVTNRLERYRQNIEYGRYSPLPSYFIFMTSITMIVGFYLPGSRGIFFPHMELARKEGGIYDAFKEHFNSLWDVTKAQEADAGREQQ